MVNKIKLWFKKKRMQKCNHRPPWDVLAVSPDLYWSAPISLEFKRTKERPPSQGGLFGFWSNARIIRCKKCGGIFSEIKLGELWLDKITNENKKYLSPYEVDELAKECGWCLDKHADG